MGLRYIKKDKKNLAALHERRKGKVFLFPEITPRQVTRTKAPLSPAERPLDQLLSKYQSHGNLAAEL